MTSASAVELLRLAPFGYVHYQLVFDDQNKAIDMIFRDVNPFFETITKLNRETILGKRVTEIIPEIRSSDFDWITFYGDISQTGQKQEFTSYFDCLGRWYRITAFSQERGFCTAIFQDITSEVENMKLLEHQKARIESLFRDLEIIFNSTHDAIFLVEVKNGEFRYIRNNAAHQKLTGLTDIKGKTPVDIFGEEAAKISIENYRRCVNEGKAHTYEDNFFFPTGEKIRLTTLTPVFEQGKVQYLVGFCKDITQQKRAERERNQLLRRLESMFYEHTAVMLLIEPITGRIVDSNPAACDFYGYSREELTSLCIQDINMLPNEEVEQLRLMALREKQRYFITPHRLKNGEIRLVDVYTSLIEQQDGEPLMFSIIFDVTDREKYKEHLYREKELMRTTLISIGDGVVTTDLEGRITALNREAEKITGWTNEEAKNRYFTDVFLLRNEETGQEIEDPISKALQTGSIVSVANHTVLINKEGRTIPIADSAAPIKDEHGQTFGVVMVFRDVSIEKEHQQQILYLSYHDHLTGLYNRRFIEEEMMRLDNSFQLPLAVIMGDVNGLKLTNDVFGHQAGDELLKSMAEVLQESCRPGDIIARWGGDEFLIMLPCTTAEQAQEIMERITARCRDKSVGDMSLNVSLGCAVKTSQDESLVQIIKEAEERMYHRKLLEGRSHRNTIINTLLGTLFEKSMETEEHAKRLEHYCNLVGRMLKLSPHELDNLTLLAMLHDIGKVAVRESILQKPGPLSPSEWEEMKRHSEIGYRIAQNSPELSIIAEYILSHHEHWNGEGYPRGLKGEEIPLISRILAVVDAFDAMTTDRVYRKSISEKEALEELKRKSGTQFDPVVIDAFCSLFK